MNNKYQILGLMYASKNLAIGQDGVLAAVRSDKAKYVLISSSASSRTIKTITDKCNFYNVKYAIIDEDGQMAKAIGKSTVMAVSTNSSGFAKKMEELNKGE
ncbi:ribosomal L7Ae/L30e/S12e/Gadd45 family protein [Mollicutes bacterium LVI A0039]|nr:ribosomal L7Ae/L30e/S12e/Gadd45 family protein [Mollicutes bacterium LVI A0039]